MVDRLEETGRSPHVLVRLADDEILEGSTADLDLDRPEFELRISNARQNTRSALIPLASVKRILIRRDRLEDALAEDLVRKVAVHFWDGEVLRGLLRETPRRSTFGMTLELITPGMEVVEVYALPYHAVKAVFFLRSWDTRPPQCEQIAGSRRWTLPRQEAPLLDLLGEIRGLRGLRHRGQISGVDYERRRSQVLNRI